MADSVFRSTASLSNFQVPYGGFGNVYISFTFNVEITIYETPRSGGVIGKLRCYFPNGSRASAWYEGDSETGTGGGFWNAAGIMWGDGSFHEQWHAMSDASEDSYGRMENELDWATSDYFVRFAFCDNVSSPDLSVWAPAGASFSRDIYQSELDSNGNLPPLVLARVFSRYYDHESGPAYSVVSLQRTITSNEMHVNWKYYPWARKLSGNWESLNRDINTSSASRSAYLRRKDSGAWHDVLNDMQSSSQSAWRKQDGAWKNAVPYGNNA